MPFVSPLVRAAVRSIAYKIQHRFAYKVQISGACIIHCCVVLLYTVLNNMRSDMQSPILSFTLLSLRTMLELYKTLLNGQDAPFTPSRHRYTGGMHQREKQIYGEEYTSKMLQPDQYVFRLPAL